MEIKDMKTKLNPTLAAFNESQRGVLTDLLVLAMYRDGHLAGREDDQVGEALQLLGLADASDRQAALDASATRVRRLLASEVSVQKFLHELRAVFPDQDQRTEVLRMLDDLVACDARITATEGDLLATARSVLGGGS